MSKGFFSRLKKSTIITMVSCISFVVMTFLALLFFVKFPITPSEKFTAGLGRESIHRQNIAENVDVMAVTETSTETTTEPSTTVTTAEKTEFKITITTGKGFRTNGHTLTVSESSDEYDGISDESSDTDDSENYDYNDYSDSDYSDDVYSDYNDEYDWN